jgi:hypothetical protein
MNSIGQALCEAWGLDPNRIMDMTIHIPADNWATVEVTLFPPADSIVAVLEHYQLHEVKGEHGQL